MRQINQPRNIQELHAIPQKRPRLQGHRGRQWQFGDSSSEEEENDEVRRWRAGPQHQHKPNEYKVKLDIPTFNGKRDIEEFFKYPNTPEHKKVQLVALKLRGGAFAWWEKLEVNRYRCGKNPITSWERMKRLMKDRFLPTNYEQILYNQYQNLQQGARSVTEYTEDFHRLGARTNLPESEQHLIARFLGGLRSDIKEKVKLQPLGFLTDAISLAETVEEHYKNRNPRGSAEEINGNPH